MGRLSSRMRAAAQANDWDQLVRLEQELADRRDNFAADAGRFAGIAPIERERITAIIRAMQADDRAIREIVEPCLGSIRDLLSRSARKRDLSRSYGAFAQSP
ncbi:MAG: flagellar protein FliT [Rhodocyclaceae bacterium]|nr:flagellar protein FliT [Rhodocyclaceae bacterium]